MLFCTAFYQLEKNTLASREYFLYCVPFAGEEPQALAMHVQYLSACNSAKHPGEEHITPLQCMYSTPKVLFDTPGYGKSGCAHAALKSHQNFTTLEGMQKCKKLLIVFHISTGMSIYYMEKVANQHFFLTFLPLSPLQGGELGF